MNDVKPGQVWRDMDKRVASRYLLVERITVGTDPMALCVRCDVHGTKIGGRYAGRITRISPRRMKPGATGYELVKDVDAAVAL